MKSGVAAPQPNDLLKGYNLFQSGRGSLEDLVAYSQWARFDPRFGEVLIGYLSLNWSKWNPIEVGSLLRKTEWPQVFAVLAEHAYFLIPLENRKLFRQWMKCALTEVKPATPQAFFIGVFSLGGKLQLREALEPLKMYTRWGYLSAHSLVPEKQRDSHTTSLSKTRRRQLLRRLLRKKPIVTVNEYIDFLDGRVSRRVAELDLKEMLHRTGRTRAARYRRGCQAVFTDATRP